MLSSSLSEAEAEAEAATAESEPALRAKYQQLLLSLHQNKDPDPEEQPEPQGGTEDLPGPAGPGAPVRLGKPARFDKVLEAMTLADQYFSSVDNPHDFLLDGRVVHTLSRFCREEAEALSANIVDFTPKQFAAKLQGHMGHKGNVPDWAILGSGLRNWSRQVPRLTFLKGALPKDEELAHEKTPRERNRKVPTNNALKVSTQLIQQTEESEGSEGKTEFLVRSTHRQLVRLVKECGGPIQYFKFVLNPNSFGATIENIFHVSFLVKEKQARIFVHDFDGLPYIQPIRAKENVATNKADSGSDESDVEDAGGKKQVVVGLDMTTWKSLVIALKISTPAIGHSLGNLQEGSKKKRI